jgi:putative transposase
MGSLFMKNFRRLKVTDENYLLNLVCYIHRNPKEAGMCKDLASYPYSSYSEILKGDNRNVDPTKTIKLFHDQQNFRECHNSFSK